ncbi:flagellin [Telmatospirillum sp. J64-1]|uniref:flagellin n=1 Tax=Telmatospirillum sp. J64-1 TaxID=2502183 RepID=UPI0021030159|nr:flagellin [Telmatospirillum sp. J64-1]
MKVVSTLAQNMTLRRTVASMQERLLTARTQMGTYAKAETYGGYGAKSSVMLSLRSNLSAIEQYQSSIGQALTRTEVMQNALSITRDSAAEVGQLALSSLNSETERATIQPTASNRLEQVVSALNTRLGDRYLFSGNERATEPVKSAEEIVTALQQVVATLDPNSPTYVDDVMAAADAMFADVSTWYNGQSIPANGTPPDRSGAAAQADTSTAVQYGVRADEQSLLDTVKSLALLSAFSESDFPDGESYRAFADKVGSDLMENRNAVTATQADLGLREEQLQSLSDKHTRSRNSIEVQIANIENVDMFEAVSLVEQLEAQLQATYTVATRMQSMSLVHYL